jgi:hypothetical protein
VWTEIGVSFSFVKYRLSRIIRVFTDEWRLTQSISLLFTDLIIHGIKSP